MQDHHPGEGRRSPAILLSKLEPSSILWMLEFSDSQRDAGNLKPEEAVGSVTRSLAFRAEICARHGAQEVFMK